MTNSVEKRPSWEVNRSSAVQEVPRILQNLKVHYRIHNSLTRVPILSQINPIYVPHPTQTSISIFCSHLILGFPIGLFVFRFSHQNPVNTSPHPSTCYTPHPFHTSWFDHTNNIGWRVGAIKLLFKQSSPLPCVVCYEAVKSNAFSKLRKCTCITLESPAAETLKTLS